MNENNLLTFNTIISKDRKKWTREGQHYTQMIIVDGIKKTDIPSIRITPSNIYKNYTAQMDSFAYITRVITYDGYIIVYAYEPIYNDIYLDIIVNR